jgi:hypothetical protein
VQSTDAAQPAGRAWHEYATEQPARQPGIPVSGQLDVALDPAGQTPASGTGVQAGVAPQTCTLTHSSWVAQAAASPHGLGTAASAFVSPPELHPARAMPAAMNASRAPRMDRVLIPEMLTRLLPRNAVAPCWNSIAIGV